jgi:hypothetical protein
MNDATKLVKVARALAEPKPPWLASEQWAEYQRNGAVMSEEEANKIITAIKEAPAVKIGGILTQIREILGGLIQ